MASTSAENVKLLNGSVSVTANKTMDFSYDINFRNSIGTVSTELALKPINNFKDNFIVFYRSIDFFLIQTKINEHAIK